jgi:thioester reductase-like protein
MRRNSESEAEKELRDLIGDDVFAASDIQIIVGDLLECELPSARHFIHAGGLTTFTNRISPYWSANVISTIKLAHHVKETKAKLHLISSISVAQHRDRKLYENTMPIPHHCQSSYTLSKCFAELAASEVLSSGSLSVYRISDVVPELSRLPSDLRHNHWLTLLMGTGYWARCTFPTNYEFFFVLGSDASRAIVKLISDDATGTFHLFGRTYTSGFLKRSGEGIPVCEDKQRVAAYINKFVGSEVSLASLVDDAETKAILRRKGFEWVELKQDYWKEFVKAAANSFLKNTRINP